MRRLIALSLALCGCGPTTYATFCEQAAAAQCRQAFRCDATSAMAVWPNVGACTTDLTARAQCHEVQATCMLDGAKTSACINDVEQAACGGTFMSPASCRQLSCTGTQNSLRCSGSRSSSSNDSCTKAKEGCSDGHDYAVRCTSAGCSCLKDDVEEKTFTDTAFCDGDDAHQQAQFKEQCGYVIANF